MTRTISKNQTNMAQQQHHLVKTGSKPGRELMHEFNKTVTSSNEAPHKRRRVEGGMIFESGKEHGESMYQTLVTRDGTPQTLSNFEQQMKVMSVGDLRIRNASEDQGHHHRLDRSARQPAKRQLQFNEDEESHADDDEADIIDHHNQNNDLFAPAQGYIYPKDYETP